MRWRNDRSGASNGSTALSLLFLFLLSTNCAAQLSDLPNLKTVTSVGGGNSDSSTATSNDKSQSTSAASSSNTGKVTSSAASSASASTITSASSADSVTISFSSSSTDGGSIFHLTGLPTIAGATDPTQVVPDTSKAPFMQKSNLPDGSVFIIVGAILGAFGACVLLWRALVAWSLSRSVKRAAIAQHQTFDLKSTAYPAPSAGMYSTRPASSTASMEQLTAMTPKKSKRGSHNPSTSMTPLTTPSNILSSRSSTQNLFFSPTAGAGHPSSNTSHLSPGNRNSNYLPAGYYASGTSQPAGGQATTQINGHAANQRGSSILHPLSDRLSGLRAESAGYQRTQSLGPSPPGSPGLPPSHGTASRTMTPGNASSVVGQVSGPTGNGGLYSQPSYSSLNLSVPGGTAQQGGRTPSAYLEDLFENHGNGPRERF